MRKVNENTERLRESLGTEYFIDRLGGSNYCQINFMYPYDGDLFLVKDLVLCVLNYSTGNVKAILDLSKFHVRSEWDIRLFVNSYGVFIYNRLLLLHVTHDTFQVTDFSDVLGKAGFERAYINGPYFYFVQSNENGEMLYEILETEPEIKYDKAMPSAYKEHLPFEVTKYNYPIKRLEVSTGEVEILFDYIYINDCYLTGPTPYTFIISRAKDAAFVASSDYLFVMLHCFNKYSDDDSLIMTSGEKPFLLNLKTKSLEEFLLHEGERLIYFCSQTGMFLCQKGDDFYYRTIDNSRREALLTKALINEKVTYFDGFNAYHSEEWTFYEINHRGVALEEKNWRPDVGAWRDRRLVTNDEVVVINMGTYGCDSEYGIFEHGRLVHTFDIEKLELPDIEQQIQGVSQENTRNSDIFSMNYKGYQATGFLSSNGFTVQKGSQVNPEIVPSCPQGTIKARQQYADRINGNVLLADIEFSSISAAASFVAGASQNGNVVWKNEKGVTFKELHSE